MKRSFWQRLARYTLLGLTALVGTLATAPAVRADNLDEALLAQKKKLFKYIHEKKAKTVGVLKFRGQIDDGPVSFTIGPINTILAERLEMVLLLGSDPSDPINVIHDANQVAVRSKQRINYLTVDGRKKLFELNYPVVSGNKPLPADIFFTGFFKIDLTKRTTAVALAAFTRDSPKVQPLNIEFEVKTDRNILADASQGFVIPRAALKKRGAFDDHFDEMGNTSAQKEKKEKEKQKEAKKPAQNEQDTNKERLAELRMFVRSEAGDYEVTYLPDPTNPGQKNFKTDRPLTVGDRVYFKLTNLSNQRIAVVLFVNGVNTLYEGKGDSRDLPKWVLDPGDQPLVVSGYYTGDTGEKNVKAFTVVPESAMDEPLSDATIGTVQMHVFGEAAETPTSQDAPGTRGLSRAEWEKAQRKGSSLASLQQQILKTTKAQSRSRGLIKGGETEDGSKLNTVEFKNPQLMQEFSLRYYDSPK